MKLIELENYLINLYDINEFNDYCPKGLTVEGKPEVLKGITAVSFGLDLLEYAIEQKVDFIVVHHLHGFWDNQSKIVRGTLKKKIQGLLNNDISLFGFHLPMDAHLKIGNNAGVLSALNAQQVGGFLREGNKNIGLLGKLQNPMTPEFLLSLLSDKVGPPNFEFMYGPSLIQKIGVCTGAAPSGVEELVALGDIDAYITGEARENTQQYCMEEGIHFIAAGHHQTECFGPQLLAQHLTKELNLEVNFINIHNPV